MQKKNTTAVVTTRKQDRISLMLCSVVLVFQSGWQVDGILFERFRGHDDSKMLEKTAV